MARVWRKKNGVDILYDTVTTGSYGQVEEIGIKNPQLWAKTFGRNGQEKRVASVAEGKAWVESLKAKDTVRTYDRARLHRALDAVMDAAMGDREFLSLMAKVGTERRSNDRLKWPGDDDPKTQAASEKAYNESKVRIKSMLSSAGISPADFKKRAQKVGVAPKNLRWLDAL